MAAPFDPKRLARELAERFGPPSPAALEVFLGFFERYHIAAEERGLDDEAFWNGLWAAFDDYLGGLKNAVQ